MDRRGYRRQPEAGSCEDGANDGGQPPAQSVGHVGGHWSGGEGDTHLYCVYCGDLPTAALEVFFKLRQEHSKTETLKYYLKTVLLFKMTFALSTCLEGQSMG